MRSFLSIAMLCAAFLPAVAASPDTNEVASEAEEIVGAWQLEFTAPDGVKRKPIVLVGRQNQDFVAWYVEDDTPEPFKQVKLTDDALVLTIRPDEQQNVQVTLRAKLEQDGVCVGQATYRADDGDTGSWKFKGRSMTAADVEEAQQWRIQFNSPDGQQREALVTVVQRKEKLYAWYASQEFDLPAQEFSMRDNEVVMLVAAKMPGGQSIEVRFRGEIDDDRIEGEAEYDMDGETGRFAFAGNRKS